MTRADAATVPVVPELPLFHGHQDAHTRGARSTKTPSGTGTTGTAGTKPWRRPPWLYDGPLTDRARLEACPRCHRPVLRALLGGHVMGLDTSAEPVRLTVTDEIHARLAGREVVALLAGRLVHRWLVDIRANRPDRPALLRHDCRHWPTYTAPPDPTLLARHDVAPPWDDEPHF